MINLEENNNTKDLLTQYNSLTLDTINQMRVEFEHSIASHIKTVQAYAELASAARAYLADPSGLTRPRLSFLLAKAPK